MSENSTRSRRLVKKAMAFLLYLVGGIMLLLLTLSLALQSQWGQAIIKDQAAHYLERRLRTRVSIGSLQVKWLSEINIRDLVVEDRQQRKLLDLGFLHIRLRTLDLLEGKLTMPEFQLKDLSIQLYRNSGDSNFNFQFIPDAFAGNNAQTTGKNDKAGSPFHFDIGRVELEKVAFLMKDGWSGMDVDMAVRSLGGNMKATDPGSMRFVMESLGLDSGRIAIATYAGTAPVKQGSASMIMPYLSADSLRLSRIDLNYTDSAQPISLHTKFADLLLNDVTADLPRKEIRAGNLLLNGHSTDIVIKSQPPTSSSIPGSSTVDTTAPYTFSISHVELRDNGFRFDDAGKPTAKSGFDAGHLDVRQVNIRLDSVSYDGKKYTANILALTGKERSGIELKRTQARVIFSDSMTLVKGLVLQTQRNAVEGDLKLGYSSLADLSKRPGKATVDLNIRKATVSLSEWLPFSATLARNEQIRPLVGKTFKLSTRMNGTVEALHITSIILTESDTRLEASAFLRNLPDLEKLNMDLQLKDMSGSRASLLSYLPKGMIADSLLHYIPNRFRISGTTKGTLDDLTAHISLASDLGDLRIDGNIKHAQDPAKTVYDIRTDMLAFHLGDWLKDSSMGKLTATVNLKGRGIDPMSANTAFDIAVREFQYRGYGYHDIGLNGMLEMGMLKARVDSYDPNLDLGGDLSYNLTKGKFGFSTNTDIRNIDLLKLGLAKDTLSLSARVRGSVPLTDSVRLVGDLLVESLKLKVGGHHFTLDTISIKATHPADTQRIVLHSSIADLDLNGIYRIKDIPEAARIIANRYIYTESSDTLHTHRVVAQLIGSMRIPDSLARMVPGLQSVAPFQVAGMINTDSSKLGLVTVIPQVRYNGMVMDSIAFIGLNLSNDRNYNNMMVVLGTKGVSSPTFHMGKAALSGFLRKGIFDGRVSIQDQRDKPLYDLPFVYTNNPSNPNLVCRDTLLVNRKKWMTNKDNVLYFGGGGMRNSRLAISNNNEEISFTTSSKSKDGFPMDIMLKDFQLENIGNIIQSDTSFLAGTANGFLKMESLNPVTLLADLRVDALAIMGAHAGNLSAKAKHTDEDHLDVDLVLRGPINDITLQGLVDTREQSTDLKLDIKALDLRMVEPFSGNYIAETKGTLAGTLGITGKATKPDISGELRFDSASTDLKMLNTNLRINGSGLRFSKDQIFLDKLIILDSAGNSARVEGSVRMPDFLSMEAELKLVARNFRVLGYKKYPEQIAYGPARADATITLKGDLNKILTEGVLKLRDSSQVTYIYSSTVSTGRGEGLIEFFDPNHPLDSSLMVASRKRAELQTAANLFITLTPSSTLTVVLDEMTGDQLLVKGTANLNMTKLPGEMVNLTGNYTVDDGEYSLTIAGLVRKKFRIQKGSSISWSGDVMKAIMDIRALYSTKTTAGELVSDIQSVPGIDKQKLGFQVYLLLTKELLKPDIRFELDMEEGDRQTFNGLVYNRIKQVNNIPSELNKQVMGLLALNHFIADNPFSSLSNGGTSVETQAYSTAGKLLTQELNSLVGNLIKGVDINFALDVKEDYTTGKAARNTDLKMGVRKSFANNRLAVYVGSSLALENQNQNTNALSGLAGDVTIEYLLSPDGRYRLKAYRINEQVMTFQGTVIKTGLTFVVTIEFNRFKEIFKSSPK